MPGRLKSPQTKLRTMPVLAPINIETAPRQNRKEEPYSASASQGQNPLCWENTSSDVFRFPGWVASLPISSLVEGIDLRDPLRHRGRNERPGLRAARLQNLLPEAADEELLRRPRVAGHDILALTVPVLLRQRLLLVLKLALQRAERVLHVPPHRRRLLRQIQRQNDVRVVRLLASRR